MKRPEQTPDSLLDSLINDIRRDEPEPAAVEAAANRVWVRLSTGVSARLSAHETIRGCADYQAMIPDYLAGRLSEARRLLLADHAHECVACRKALDAARSPRLVPAPPEPRRPLLARWPVWAAAAAAAVAFVAIGAAWTIGRLPAPAGQRARVYAVNGALYRVAAQGPEAIGPGAEIGQNTPVRTVKGATAVVRLGDGSLVEMRERTELSLSERRRDTTIRLERGAIIVQAARQRDHLYVAAGDATVSVTGTVFSVNRGVKGSRISVIEGEVRVAQNNARHVLRPGEQVSTHASLGQAPIEDEIAWSQNREKHLALLREFAVLGRKIQTIPGPGLRYSSNLLSRLPAGTLLYAALPNIGETAGEAHRMLRDQLQQSPALREWWEGRNGVAADRLLEEVHAFGRHLGDEIVLAVLPDERGRMHAPLLLAEVRSGEFRAWAEQELAAFKSKSGGDFSFRVVESPESLTTPFKGLTVLIQGNLMAASPEAEALRAAAGPGGLAASPFGTRIAECYRNGAQWLIAADLEHLTGKSVSSSGGKRPESYADAMEMLGLNDARYLILERKEAGGVTDANALLAFSGERRGLASWLAAPAPVGGLEFVSPDAGAATAFIAKNPQSLVQELFDYIEKNESKFRSERLEFESRTGISIADDLAGPLSGEMVFAIDGALLPLPEWKLIAEVYDANRLQASIEKLIGFVNSRPESAKLEIAREVEGGRTYYALRGLKAGLEIHYVYADGYLVAGPNRQVVARALQTRLAGYSLPRSDRFAVLLPRDRNANFSAMVYQNLTGAISALAEKLSPEQRQSLGVPATDTNATMLFVYGDADRITLASHGSLFGVTLENLTSGLPFSLFRQQNGPGHRTR